MTNKSNLEDALAYASIGWHVFPCVTETKAPKVSGGFHAATREGDQIRQWWAEWPTASIGVACKASGLFVIDLDVSHEKGRNGIMAWKYLQQNRGEDGAEVIALTRRGGHHILYKRPHGDRRVTTTDNIIPGSGIDVRGDGGYFIAPGACDAGREWYEGDPLEDPIPSAPAWIIEMVCTKEDSPLSGNPDGGMFNKEMPLGEEEVASIRSALEYIDPNPHDTWIRIGMALRSTGARDQALALWAHWSMQSPKWDEEAALKRWASIREYRFDGSEIKLGTLFAIAAENGWSGEEVIVAEPAPSAPAEVRAAATDASKGRPFPSELLNFPGLVNDIAAGALRASKHSPQPALAFASGLAATAALMARRVEDPDGMRTNLYIGLVAETGAGKDAPLRYPSMVFQETGIERVKDRIGPSTWTSDAAIRRVLQQKPALIAAMDELGMWFKQVHDPRASAASTSAKSLFLSLYSSGRGSILQGTAYAVEKERPQVDLVEPCLVFLGAGTPETCFRSAGSQGAEDGFLNRFLFVQADDVAPEAMTESEARELPSLSEVAESIRNADRFFGEPGMFVAESGDGPPARRPTVMEWTPEASARLDALARENRQERRDSGDPHVIAMLARKVLNIKRVALTLAAGQDPSHDITEEALVNAEQFVSWCYDRTLASCTKYIGRSEHEVLLNEAEEVCSMFVGEFTKGDFLNRMRHLDMMKSGAMLSQLITMGVVEQNDGKIRYRSDEERHQS